MGALEKLFEIDTEVQMKAYASTEQFESRLAPINIESLS